MNQSCFNVSVAIIIPTEKGLWDYMSMHIHTVWQMTDQMGNVHDRCLVQL